MIGFGAGVLSALFLFVLDLATFERVSHPWLIYGLPFAGAVIALLYDRFGPDVERGTPMVLEQIHGAAESGSHGKAGSDVEACFEVAAAPGAKTAGPGAGADALIRFRLVPLILIGTWLTHLFGGSAGREGTAVQMGAAFADQISRQTSQFGFANLGRRELLLMGLSAGFGAVFGVPWAGSIFGIEVVTVGRLEWRLWPACALASWLGHLTVLMCGVHHAAYPGIDAWSLQFVLSVLVSGLIFGLTARVFSLAMHFVNHESRRWIRSNPLRAFVGGVLVAFGFWLLATDRYAGLGVPVIQNSLSQVVPALDFAWKSLFTVLTLGFGLKGGEVTPLLFIGSTLGNTLSLILPAPLSLLASVGLVAVFAGAANVPLAGAVMAMELFGYHIGPLALVGCLASTFVSGFRGIYPTQLIGRSHRKLRLRRR